MNPAIPQSELPPSTRLLKVVFGDWFVTFSAGVALLAASPEDAAALRVAVTSPGGTTIEGVHELELGGLRGTVMSAVRAAADKSRKLGQG